jgi:hypothetical protein
MSGFIRVRDLALEGGPDRALRRGAERGEVTRVARGRYMTTSEWTALDLDAQYRTRIHAFAETTRTPPVFSHWSAAVLWGYPVLGKWPDAIHVTTNSAAGQHSTPGVVRHNVALGDDIVERDGIHVTSPLRTIVDLSRVASFASGVAACDRALTEPKWKSEGFLHVPREAILERAARLTGKRGVQRLRAVAEFADGRAGSPGESLSRVQFRRLRLPAPDLQVAVTDHEGRHWYADFGWQHFGLLGEFDGLVKYTRSRYLQGRDASGVVFEEKVREDAIRAATGFRVVRWNWEIASDAAQLGRLLQGAGLRPEP